MSQSSSSSRASYNAEKEKLKKELATAWDTDDPLAPYTRLIKHISESGTRFGDDDELIEALEEATRVFKDDDIYKGDLRYLKLWIQYAKCTGKPEEIYKYLMEKDIGTVYCHLYEEYAVILERQGRCVIATTL